MPWIKHIDLLPHTVNRSAVVTAKGTITDRQGYLITVEDGEGTKGYGEAAPLEVIGTENFTACAQILQQSQTDLIGIHWTSIAEIADILKSFDRTPAARYGMELALLDLLARHHQLPLVNYLNAAIKVESRSKLPVNALIGMVRATEAHLLTAKYLTEGYQCIKIKVGDRSFAQDRERVMAVRRAGGKALTIRLDANGAWTLSEADRYLQELVDYNIEYIEQPVASRQDMAILKSISPIPIAVDESILNIQTLQEAIVQDIAHLIILKPMGWGGVLPTIAAAQIASKYGWDVVITSALEGLIGTMGSLHTALSLLQVTRPCGFYPADHNQQGYRSVLPGNGLGDFTVISF